MVYIMSYHFYQRTSQRGFTLIELMMAVAILGVLASLAAPALTETIKKYQTRAITDELIGSIEVARSEARRRGRTVLMGAYIDQTAGCATPTEKQWQCWRLWWTELDGTERTIQVFHSPPSHAIQVASSPISFNRWGQTTQTQFLVFNLRDGESGSATHTVCLSIGGKILRKKGIATCA